MGERLGPIGISGCSLCLVGSLIIVLHAPEDKEIATVDEILDYALQPGASHDSSKQSRFLSLTVASFLGHRVHVLLSRRPMLLALCDLPNRP